MSAWTVSDKHIAAMLNAGLAEGRHNPMTWYVGNPSTQRVLDFTTVDAVGQMLWQTNHDSVNFRCRENTQTPEFHYSPFIHVHMTAVEVLKLIDCYEYQSCEHDAWETSEAKTFCDSLRARVTTRLPGYDEARWGI